MKLRKAVYFSMKYEVSVLRCGETSAVKSDVDGDWLPLYFTLSSNSIAL